MRKLLLASAAALGAFIGVAGPASAQLVTFSENPNAPMPPPTQWSRSGAFGYVQNTPPIPAPGTAVVRISGYIVEYVGATGGLGQLNSPPNANPAIGGSKLGNPDIFGYIRLYPSLEGVAANGLKYGAFAEIRQDASSGAGGGAAGSISGGVIRRAPLYWRRAFVYFGTDQLGTLRFGSADQPTSLMITGTTENFDNGGWNGDVPGIVGALGPIWPFEDVGNLYTTEKVVYLSPEFAGFDFGASYEPNTGNMSGGFNCNGFAGVGCDTLSSTGGVAGADDTTRRRNTFDGVLRYRGSFGIVGVALTAGGIASGRVQNSDTQPFPAGVFQRTGLAVGDVGAQITIGGLALQAHGTAGTFNPAAEWNTLPIKGEGRGVAWTAGASYTIGPLVAGVQYFNDTGGGNQTPTNAIANQVGKLTDWGFAAGATYSVTPGFGFFASYIYGQRKENGFDLVAGTPDPFNGNKLHVQAAALGTYVKW